ncbi:hypothetical protein S40293_11349 [Stachybotrys chartarum IBT 40293]|nr:hypothetical protein S40293_11349 [Stachybotrys chartarum IBT 40293]
MEMNELVVPSGKYISTYTYPTSLRGALCNPNANVNLTTGRLSMPDCKSVGAPDEAIRQGLSGAAQQASVPTQLPSREKKTTRTWLRGNTSA